MTTSKSSKSAAGLQWRIRHDPADVARYLQKGWWRRQTLLDDFLGCVDAHPDKAAIVAYTTDRGVPHTVTYGQLGKFVDRCARALIELGIERGDIVSLQLPNGWEFPVLALAAMRAGAIPNPIPTIYRELEVSFMLRHAGSKMLVVPSEFRGFSYAALAHKLLKEIPALEHAVSIGGDSTGLVDFESHFLGKHRKMDREFSGELNHRLPAPDDPAVLLFTSGTTGTPKAAVHTYNTIWSAGRPAAEASRLSGRDVCFMASTMGHLTGFYWGMLLPLSMGQKVVYQDVWDAVGLVEIIDTERVTWTLSATPFAIDLLDAQQHARQPLTSLRAFICGGAQIPPQIATRLKAQLGVDLLSLWGCTEVGICAIHQLGAPIETLAGSDGMPVPWVELRIVDEDLEPVKPGQEGRLQVRGPSIFVGYLNQPELTAALQTRDGWFDTGDLGRATVDGGIRITGRSKDIIIRGGQNVPVVEIENELAKHPAVKEVVVVGVPDPRLGERGCAVIVPKGTPPSLEDLKAHLAGAGMAKQFWPERLEIIDAMPRTPAGKIQKYVLRERLAASSPASE